MQQHLAQVVTARLRGETTCMIFLAGSKYTYLLTSSPRELTC